MLGARAGSMSAVEAWAGYVAPPVTASNVFINPSAINYFAPAVPLLNLYQMGEGFRNELAGGSSAVMASYDSDGYPMEVPFGIGGLAQKVTQYCAALAYTGHYVCKWDGDGDITIYNASSTISSVPNRIVVNVASVDLNDSLVVQITRSNPADHIRNIRLVHASHEAALDGGQLWHPDYLAKLSGVGGLRFMDWGGTNWSSNVLWANRTTPTQLQGNAYKGVSYEHMIDLCNTLGCDMWVNIPHRADNTYVANLAQLIFDNLDAGLNVHVEYSNEVWNGIFSDGVAGPGTHGQFTWAVAQGLALGLDHVGDYQNPTSGYDFWAGIKYQTQRSTEIFQIFKGILGAAVTRVIGSQAGNAEVSNVIIRSLANAAVCPLRTDPDAACDAIAIAPYAGGGIIDAMYTAGAPKTADEIFTRLMPRVVSDTTAFTAAHYTLTHAAGLGLVSYEFGQHLVGTDQNAVNDNGLTAALIAANHDSRMLDFYRLIIAAWITESHGGIINFFSWIAPDSKFGAWGMLVSQTEVESPTTPKYTAYLEAA